MKKIIVNCDPWQTRIAITWKGELQNIYFSTYAESSLERTFFKGTVMKVLPGIQTAFVDIGQERAGFLHISEIDRELAIKKIKRDTQIDEEDKDKRYIKKIPNIANIFKEKDTILVQVSKEPVHEKGAKLTTCFTLPGRFLVLMPNIPRMGVSKKIEDRNERKRLKEIIRQHLPKGMGAIIRTTSAGKDEAELLKDLTYLIKEWQTIEKKFIAGKPQQKIYEDLDLFQQIIRDHLDDDVELVITDNKKNKEDIYTFVKKMASEYTSKIRLYTGPTNIFSFYNIELQIKQGLDRKVNLTSGGVLIVETTEAMTVIDVNTGRFTGKRTLEKTIWKTNIEAAEATVHQLKLRNIGGLIVIDFIDMAIPANRQKLFFFFEKILRERDKFQSVVLKVSDFGIVQMTRKRSGKTLIQQLTTICPTCQGLGFIKSIQAISYDILRSVMQELRIKRIGEKITLAIHPDIFTYITSTEYNAILWFEKLFTCKISILANKKMTVSEYTLT